MNPDELAAAFASAFGAPPAYAARAPGRVNLLGEHVDYNQGLALPMAIELEARVVLGGGQAQVVDLMAVDMGARVSLSLEALAGDPADLQSRLPAWARLPAGVAWAWARSGRRLTGLCAAYACDVPSGSGLSSSSAIEMALARGMSGFLNQPASGLELAQVCQASENAVAGVSSGLMDPWVSAEGRRGHALLLDFADLTARRIRLPERVSVVVADTGVRRSLSASAYNQRVGECRQAVAELAGLGLSINSLRQVRMDEFERLAGRLSEASRRRAQHVVEEIERVRAGAACLESGDPAGFGALMNASHASLRYGYQVSGPELDHMVEAAQSQDGCFGSRLTGAGFGGSTVSLVDALQAEAFCQELARRYTQTTGRTASISGVQGRRGRLRGVDRRNG